MRPKPFTPTRMVTGLSLFCVSYSAASLVVVVCGRRTEPLVPDVRQGSVVLELGLGDGDAPEHPIKGQVGTAGLTSAVWPAEAGKNVTLLERRGSLGGRTHAMKVEQVDDRPDNGQHRNPT